MTYWPEDDDRDIDMDSIYMKRRKIKKLKIVL